MPFDTVVLNDGTRFPALAFGTGTKWKGVDVAEYVEQALETGFVHIDTAAFYENEGSVGVGLRQSGLARTDFYVTTKYISGDVRESITTSLNKLGLKKLDLYLIHVPRLDDLPSIWKSFEQFQKDGLTTSIGVSNFTVGNLQEILKVATVTPAVNQISFNPYNYHEYKELIKFVAEHNILLEAYGSLAPITRYPGGPVDKPILAAAKRLRATPAQIILAWVRSKGVAIVTTSSSKKHLEEYLGVAELSPLTEEEIAAIDKAGANGPPVIFGITKSGLKNIAALAFIAGAMTYATLRWVLAVGI